MPLGSDQEEPTLAGEVCYSDGAGALCRGWNWREGQRTMLTPRTTKAFLVMESLDPGRSGDMKAALEELAEGTERFLGGTTTVHLLKQGSQGLELD